MMEFKVLKCEKGLYISNGTSLIHQYRINGNGDLVLKPTFSPKWFLVEGCDELHSLEYLGQAPVRGSYWELVDKEDSLIGLPDKLTKEDSLEWYDDDDREWCFGVESKFRKYRSLYKRTTLYSERPWVNVDIKVIEMGSVSSEDVDNFSDMKIELHGEAFGTGNSTLDLSGIVSYDELDRMLTPPIALHNRPCALSSSQTYRLVRAYIKDNIDPYYAQVTSDYDFCFKVAKKIRVKPYKQKSEILKSNGRSYAKPKFKLKTISHKNEAIFEMTCSSKRYKGYTVIEGFTGESLEDLKENIKGYLDILMEFINRPLDECEHCKGMGALVHKRETNDRG